MWIFLRTFRQVTRQRTVGSYIRIICTHRDVSDDLVDLPRLVPICNDVWWPSGDQRVHVYGNDDKARAD